MLNKFKNSDWLEDIQNRSWEPEIILSSLILTSIFLTEKYIFNFHAMLIQDIGIPLFISSASFNLITLVIASLKILLITHLTLRGVWTAAIGLSYVYPDGVIRKNLKKYSKNFIHSKPKDIVIQLEKKCSVLFSYILIIVIFLFQGVLGYFPMTILFFIFDKFLLLNNTVNIALSFLVFLISINIYSYFYKKKKKKKKASLNVNFQDILSTNKNKVVTIGIFILVVGMLLSLNQFVRFSKTFPLTKKEKSKTYEVINNNYYINRRNNDFRFSKATINDFYFNKNFIELFICLTKEDKKLLKKLKTKENNEKLKIENLYEISLNNTSLNDLKWFLGRHFKTNQKGFLINIPITNLEIGEHTLKIKKYQKTKKEKKLQLDNWIEFPFIKTN